MTGPWIDVCAASELEAEDVRRFDHGGRSFAIYRTATGAVFATDGLCTHEQAHLADGLLTGTIIECPMHNGRFDIRSGKAQGAPACIDLGTYPARIENGRILVAIP
jgi:3-phenylpropionate/trans-cinnamate dioxygenase ferredoxin component